MRRVTTVLIAAVALLGIAAAGLAASACGGSSVPSDAVATVGDVTVTKADFEQLLAQAQTQMKAQGMKVPAEGQRHLRPLRRARSSTTSCRSRSWRRAPRSSACP